MAPITNPDSASERVAYRGRVVQPDKALDDGLVVVESSRIAWVGPVAEARSAGFGDLVGAHDPEVMLLPGLVDLHNHGGGGEGFPDALTVDAARVAAREHVRHGTTSVVASLVTAPPDDLMAQIAILADLAETGDIVGIHLEGPFLSAARCGAQNPSHMLLGDTGLVRHLAEAARGYLLTMTVAPEVEGVVERGGVLETLAELGAVPSFGHTDASYAQVAHGIDVATAVLRRPRRPTVTHLFNGMRPLHHRDPGPVAAALEAAARGDVVVELVADGLHLDPGTVAMVFATAGADNIALVTDALAATGVADGVYALGPQTVIVDRGIARLAPTTPDGVGAIAGGSSHLVDVVRRVVGDGIPLVEAVRAASATPAAAVGLTDVGALLPGRRADILVTDMALEVRDVIVAGRSHL